MNSARCCRYVPFYGSQLWSDLSGHQDHVNNEGACKPIWTDQATDDLIADFWADAPTLLPLLGTKPHWMQLSEIEWMIYRGCDEGWGIPLGCHPLAAHMTFATPEPLTATNPWYRRQRFYGSQPSHNNSVPVPYLGHIHRVSIHHRAKLLAEEGVASKKEFLATMSFGSWRRAHLRELVAQQCQEAPGECWYMGYSSFGEVIDSYRRAWFCVHPHGDTPTRSALLDCLASGLAVPAVFDEHLMTLLPFADVVDFGSMLAYVPPDNITLQGGNLLDALRAISPAERASMLAAVQGLSHAFQYAVRPPPRRMPALERCLAACGSLSTGMWRRPTRPLVPHMLQPLMRGPGLTRPGWCSALGSWSACRRQVQPNHLLVRFDSLSTIDAMDDALTMSFKAVLRHACRREHHHCHKGRSHKMQIRH